MIPLDLTSDIVGPLGRSVEDTVRVLEVTVGVDTQDNLTTLQSTFNIPKNYTQFLQANALRVSFCWNCLRYCRETVKGVSGVELVYACTAVFKN